MNAYNYNLRISFIKLPFVSSSRVNIVKCISLGLSSTIFLFNIKTILLNFFLNYMTKVVEDPRMLGFLTGQSLLEYPLIMEIRSFINNYRKNMFSNIYLYLDSTCSYSELQPLQKFSIIIWRWNILVISFKGKYDFLRSKTF